MSQSNSVDSGRANVRLWMLTVAALSLAIALPLLVKFATNRTAAEELPTGPSLFADLAGVPIAGQTPHGTSSFYPAGENSPAYVVAEVFNVNLPANTHLNVFVNDTNLGMVTIDLFHHGFFYAPHSENDPPVVINAGDVMSITPGTVPGGDSEILHGTFAPVATPTPFPSHSPFPTQSPRPTRTPSPEPTHSPFPTPSPHPTHTPSPEPTHSPFPTPSPHPTHTPFPTPTGSPVPPVHLFAPLTGDPIGGITPRGLGTYFSFNGEIIAVLDVYVSFVNLPEGTQLGVDLQGTNIGMITLHEHMGALHLSSDVPAVQDGDSLTILNGETTIMAGTFSSSPPPLPTPSPRMSPSPHMSPTPHASPSPVPPHAFGASLDGDQVVPPVTTDGNGHGFVLLNRDETEISVFVGFRHLSSDVTTVTINGPAEPGSNGDVIFTLTMPAGPPNTLPFQTFPVTAEQVTQLRANLWYFLVSTTENPDGEIRGQIHSFNHRDDFDGDGVSEISVMRPGRGNDANTWYVLNSNDNSLSATQIGQPGDINVQGDYDGDGTADVAMFTPSTGNWQLRLSATGLTQNRQWGMNGDIPIVGDYDGDGINDLAVFRPSNGNWYISRSVDNVMMAQHWGTNGDRPVAGDFDGDGLNDLAVFRPSSGDWYISRSHDGGMTAMHWGLSGDRPVAGDFDGDGRADVAVFRPSEGNWYIYRSSDLTLSAVHFGLSGDVPVPCEFDGDGATDIAVFRPSEGNWYILRSSDNTMASVQFGISTDRPLTTAYAP